MMINKLLCSSIILLLLFSCNKKEEFETQPNQQNLSISNSEIVSTDPERLFELAKQNVDKFPDKALLYASELSRIAKAEKNKLGELRAYYITGYVYEGKRLYGISLTNYLNSLQIGLELKDKSRITNCYQGIANIHFKVGLYEDAISFYNKALENLEDQKMIAKVYRDIGKTYRENKDYDQAKNYFIKSLNIRKILGDQYELADSYNDVGNLLKEMNEYDQALGYLHQSLTISQSLPDSRLMSFGLYNIGYIYYKQKNYVQANEYYTKALPYAEEVTNFPELLISLHRDMGLNESSMNRFNEAIIHLEKAEAIAQGNTNSRLVIEVTGILSDVYKKLGNEKKALFYSDKSRSIQVENFKEEFQQIKNQFQQQTEVKQISKGSIALQKQDPVFQYLSWIVGILASILIFIFLVLKFKLIRRNELLNEIEQYEERIKGLKNTLSDTLKHIQRQSNEIQKLENDRRDNS